MIEYESFTEREIPNALDAMFRFIRKNAISSIDIKDIHLNYNNELVEWTLTVYYWKGPHA